MPAKKTPAKKYTWRVATIEECAESHDKQVEAKVPTAPPTVAPAEFAIPARQRPKPMYADWLANEENIKRIKMLLLDPWFTELNDIIVASAEVSEALLLTDQAPDHFIVRKAAVAVGLRQYTRKMLELCIPRREPTPEAIPYAHYLPKLEV
jgi:hypothetical protein